MKATNSLSESKDMVKNDRVVSNKYKSIKKSENKRFKILTRLKI